MELLKQQNANQPFSYSNIQQLRINLQKERQKNYKKLLQLSENQINTVKNQVIYPLVENQVKYKSEMQKMSKEIKEIFENVIDKNYKDEDLEEDKELDQTLEKLLKAKNNIESVLAILEDFADFQNDIEALQLSITFFKNQYTSQTENEQIESNQYQPPLDFLKAFKKLRIMLFLKNKMQNHQELTQRQREDFRQNFKLLDIVNDDFEKLILETILKDLNSNLARENPSLVVKIVRIMENERFLEESIKQQDTQNNQLQQQTDNQQNFDRLSPFEEITKIKKNKMLSLKEKCIKQIKESIEKQIDQRFKDLKRGEVDALNGSLEVSLELISHLQKYIKKYVVPCFPPYYKIYENFKDIYVNMIHDHLITNHIPKIAEYMQSYKADLLLEVHAFIKEVTQGESYLNEPENAKFQDLYFRLTEFYPFYLDYSEKEFKERFDRILAEQRLQEKKIIENEKDKKKKMQMHSTGNQQIKSQFLESVQKHLPSTQKSNDVYSQYETTFVSDVFDFLDNQLIQIQTCLTQEQLQKFIIQLVKCLSECTSDLVSLSGEEKAKIHNEEQCKDVIISLVIRSNDLTNLLGEFDDFKQDCCFSYINVFHLSNNSAGIFDDIFKKMLSQQRQISNNLARISILKEQIQLKNLINLFTLKENQKDLGSQDDSVKQKQGSTEESNIEFEFRSLFQNHNSTDILAILDQLQYFLKEFNLMLHQQPIDLQNKKQSDLENLRQSIFMQIDQNVCLNVFKEMQILIIDAYIQRVLLLFLNQSQFKPKLSQENILTKSHQNVLIKDAPNIFWMIPKIAQNQVLSKKDKIQKIHINHLKIEKKQMIEFIIKIIKNDIQTFKEWQFENNFLIENIKIQKDSFEYKTIKQYLEIQTQNSLEKLIDFEQLIAEKFLGIDKNGQVIANVQNNKNQKPLDVMKSETYTQYVKSIFQSYFQFNF